MSDVHKNIRRIAELNPQFEVQVFDPDDKLWLQANPTWRQNCTYRLINKETGDMVMESHALDEREVAERGLGNAIGGKELFRGNQERVVDRYTLLPQDYLDGCVKAAIALLMKPERSIAEVRKARAWLTLGLDGVDK